MQLELFSVPHDDRIHRMQRWIFNRLLDNGEWSPSAIELIEISDAYGLGSGQKVLDKFEYVLSEYKNFLNDLNEEVDEV